MGDVLPDLPAALQAGGALGLLVVFYLRLALHARQDRAEARAEVKSLRARIATLEREREDDRRARWKAEDVAARYRRLYGPLPEGDADGRP